MQSVKTLFRGHSTLVAVTSVIVTLLIVCIFSHYYPRIIVRPTVSHLPAASSPSKCPPVKKERVVERIVYIDRTTVDPTDLSQLDSTRKVYLYHNVLFAIFSTAVAGLFSSYLLLCEWHHLTVHTVV